MRSKVSMLVFLAFLCAGVSTMYTQRLVRKPVSEKQQVQMRHGDDSQQAVLDGASDAVWRKTMQGYRAFQKKYPVGSRFMKSLAEGQSPEIMVVGCVDSRVDMAILLGARPGTLFTERNVANIVPPFQKDQCRHGTGAALEYGIDKRFLNVKHLIIVGHSKCGGIKALLTGLDNKKNTFIMPWVSQTKAALETLPEAKRTESPMSDDTVDECAKAALKESYKHCLEYPFIAERVKDGSLIIHVWFFDIGKGMIYMWAKDKEDKPWEPIDEKTLNRFLESKRARVQ